LPEIAKGGQHTKPDEREKGKKAGGIHVSVSRRITRRSLYSSGKAWHSGVVKTGGKSPPYRSPGPTGVEEKKLLYIGGGRGRGGNARRKGKRDTFLPCPRNQPTGGRNIMRERESSPKMGGEKERVYCHPKRGPTITYLGGTLLEDVYNIPIKRDGEDR